ncbi:MAG TPA: response regulator [Polyangia bacterium]|nr:response regulator [Polyangia bacterium]
MEGARSILIVDDDEDFRHTLMDGLSYEGLEVHAVGNGQEALDWLALHAGQVSTIVLDIMMPVMDGRAFLERRASDARLASIPVVVLTAGGDCRELRKTYQFDSCLPKTTALTELMAAIRARSA